jgi:hypothetical protein
MRGQRSINRWASVQEKRECKANGVKKFFKVLLQYLKILCFRIWVISAWRWPFFNHWAWKGILYAQLHLRNFPYICHICHNVFSIRWFLLRKRIQGRTVQYIEKKANRFRVLSQIANCFIGKTSSVLIHRFCKFNLDSL